MSKTTTTAATPPNTPRPMTKAEIEAAAQADPDAQPLTEADMATMPRIPRAKTLRRALGLTQQEFATRYHIPLGTLRDREQGRAEPDQPVRAYLKAIAGNASPIIPTPQPPIDKTTGSPYLMSTFEWDDTKATLNLQRHGITFETATHAFRDPFAIEWIDTRQPYAEERVILLALAAGIILYVAYTERGDTIRLISARRATRHEQNHYYRRNTP